MERDASDVASVPFKGEERIWIRGFDVVEFDCVVACGREEAFVGGDAESIYLRVGVLDCAGADAGEGFPEAVSHK